MPTTTVAATTPSPAAKAAPQPHPVSEDVEKMLKTMREQLAASRLGHLGRRLEMLARDSQEAIDTYGSKVIVAKLAGQDVRLPVKTTIAITASIECNGVQKAYSFVLGSEPVPRPEATLDGFAPTA